LWKNKEKRRRGEEIVKPDSWGGFPKSFNNKVNSLYNLFELLIIELKMGKSFRIHWDLVLEFNINIDILFIITNTDNFIYKNNSIINQKLN
jgi:hypothetical protein